jgi:hypothetical protein
MGRRRMRPHSTGDRMFPLVPEKNIALWIHMDPVHAYLIFLPATATLMYHRNHPLLLWLLYHPDSHSDSHPDLSPHSVLAFFLPL